MLFLRDNLEERKEKEKGQKGGFSTKMADKKIKRRNINNDFMYINYEI